MQEYPPLPPLPPEIICSPTLHPKLPPDYCKCYCENKTSSWNKRLCIALSLLFVSSCMGLGVGIYLQMMEKQRDKVNLSVLKQQTEKLINTLPGQTHSHPHPQDVLVEKGSFKSITNGTYAVYNTVGDLLYMMENVRKEDSGDVLFSELKEYQSAENVDIDIRLIEAPKSVILSAR